MQYHDLFQYRNKSKNSSHWTYAAVACTNAGGIRNSVLPGEITYGDVVTVQPFENTWDVVEIKGEDLLNVCIKHACRHSNVTFYKIKKKNF